MPLNPKSLEMSLEIEPIKSRSYTMEQVDGALLALCVNGGNSIQTAKQLKERGMDVASSTLREWKLYDYPKRYAQIHSQHFSALEDTLVRNERELALAASQASLKAVQKASEQIDQGIQDPARAAQALATTAGIATDKLLTLTGRPTATIQHVDSEAILRKYGGHLEGTARELTSEPTATPGQLLTESDDTNAHE